MLLKDRIVEVSSNMFVNEGIKAVRMDDIAARLGMSKRTLYEQFKDKETLILACLDYYHTIQLARQNELTMTASNVIEAFIIILNEWDKNAEAGYQIMSNLRKFYPKIYERITNENFEDDRLRLKNTINLGVQQGLFLDNVDMDLAISVFTYSLYGLISREGSTLLHNVSPADTFKYIITYFFRGISTEKGIKLLDEYLSKTNS